MGKKVNSLRFKWVALIITITSFALVTVGTANYLFSKNSLLDKLSEQYLSHAIYNSKNLEDWIQIRIEEGTMLQRDPVMINGTLEQKLQRLNDQYLLKDKQSIGIAELNGNLTLTNGQKIDVSMRENYLRSLQGEISIAEPFKSTFFNEYIFTVYVPLFDEEGTVTSSIGFAFDANEIFEKYLQVNSVPKETEVIVLNNNGSILYNKNNAFKDLNFLEIQNLQRKLKADGTGTLSIQNKKFSGQVFYTQLYNRWHVIYAVPESVINEPIKKLFLSTLFVILVTVTLLGLLIVFISHSLVIKRLEEIIRITGQVANGQLKVPSIPTSGSDELSLIANSVNKMTNNLINIFEPFETIVKSNEYAMIVTDPNLKITSFNEYAEKLTGYSGDEVMNNLSIVDLLCPYELEERGGAKPFLKLVIEKHFISWEFCDKEQNRKATEINVNEIVTQEGLLKGYVFLVKDISDYINQMVTNERLLSIVENAKDYIISFNNNGELLYLNKVAIESLNDVGTTRDKKRFLKDYVTASTHTSFTNGIQAAAKHGFVEMETTITGAKGNSFDASMVIVSHKNFKNNEVYFSAIIRDITALKEAQRKQDLAIEQVKEANQAKTLFLAKMSHEIRTPLNGVIGLAELLQNTDLQKSQRDYVDKITLSSQILLNLINDVLDFSKIEADKVLLVEEEFCIHEMIKRLSSTTGVLLNTKPIDIIFDVDRHIPANLIGDPFRLEQILMNLVQNAIKFTEKGLITLTVSAHKIHDMEYALTFQVSDTGIGMSKLEMQGLFREFTQIDETINRRYGGTGLGLFIVKTLVEKMGGNLIVESEKGRGSILTFQLFFKSGTVKNELQLAMPENTNILIIDKNPIFVEQLRKMLPITVNSIYVPTWNKVNKILEEYAFTHCIFNLNLDHIEIEKWIWLSIELKQRKIDTIGYTKIFEKELLLNTLKGSVPDHIVALPLNIKEVYEVLQSTEPLKPTEPVKETPTINKILIVEDNSINQEVVRGILSDGNYTIEVVDSGKDTLKLLEENNSFDLILMDIHMPEMNGYETTTKIKEIPIFKTTPIIALTADLTIFSDNKRDLFDAFITKPIDRQLLVETIEFLLNRNVNQENNEGIIDWEEAVHRLGGKYKILNKLLKDFRTENESIVQTIKEKIEKEQYEEARKIVHTIKGASANLSLKVLYNRANELEKCIIKRDPNMFTSLLLLHLSLEKAFKYIDLHIPRNFNNITQRKD
ncbi:ATP-binding protein [Alkalihalobacterium sp. APHAB7]|uniref:ATP-binding protein n=1 Tax=Alkalihalobacterium sp. APHAB7 TaxID=3402081 RepID=UPI003AAD57E3